ncbi:MAG: TauD/TfdA family dioxygenase [Sphingomonadales bacterium]|nr:TauD/TfdA family dioxygenase [Sphingomonadales bacterium]
MSYTVEPIKPLIGAVVRVDSKDQMFAPGFAEEILGLLDKHGAIVFPQLGFTDEEQLRFTDTLGERCNFTNDVPGGNLAQQDVYTITLDKDVNDENEYVYGSMYFHMDGICSPIPPSPITLLSCKKKAEHGGQTEFANTYAAWNALSPAEQAKLEGLRVVHTTAAAVREILPKEALNPKRANMEHEHPLVWTHKDGRKSLLIGCHADYIVGMPKVQGRLILNRLMELASRPEFCIRHEWTVGDFAMWDNTGMLHRAVPYAEDSGRRMHRTSVAAQVEIA